MFIITMKNSYIAWTDHTFNGWTGCSKISAGCANCYAEEQQAIRFGNVIWGAGGTRNRTSDQYWRQPLKWNRDAENASERPRVFCNSLSDVFEDRTDLQQWRLELFELIRSTPNLDWQVLTKRPGVAADFFRTNCMPHNIWLGTSVENKACAQDRIPVLQSIDARIRFLSMEPLLGDPGKLDLRGIHWVIVGGESGNNFRTMQPEWARSVRDQCRSAGVKFFFKQWSGRHPKQLGFELDGVAHHAFPA